MLIFFTVGWLAWERFRCNTDCKKSPENCIRLDINLCIWQTAFQFGPIWFRNDIRSQTILPCCIMGSSIPGFLGTATSFPYGFDSSSATRVFGFDYPSLIVLHILEFELYQSGIEDIFNALN